MMSQNVMVCVDDFEDYAKKHLPLRVWAFYGSGAGMEHTLSENRTAYRRILLKPRVLKDVSTRTMSTRILGQEIAAPICISPSAYHGMAHPDGEVATATAAANMNTIIVLSSESNKSLEEVSAATPNSNKWLAIYIWPTREVSRDMVKRAEKAGFKAIVVTVDIAQLGVKRRLEYFGGHSKLMIPPLGSLKRYFAKLSGSENKHPEELDYGDPSATWEDITWLQSVTSLPIVLKGILTVEDAVLAAKHGVQGIIVSNHGGRQLDGVSATIDVLPDVVKAVGNKLEVYIDGGVRTGTDVLKALALGAKAVFVGRPVIFGLAYKGADGVKQVLQILRDELNLSMALTGCSQLEDITPSLLMKSVYHSKL
ncbi:2-Hydroxyacid oxidase 2-like [Glandiceps talaboti]